MIIGSQAMYKEIGKTQKWQYHLKIVGSYDNREKVKCVFKALRNAISTSYQQISIIFTVN